jgi:predicted nucleic acid-binding protein
MRALLDVNVLIALLDAGHIHHRRASEWLENHKLLGHRQITDSYLLGLAVRHQCRFVTFDTRIDSGIVKGAGPHHWVTL